MAPQIDPQRVIDVVLIPARPTDDDDLVAREPAAGSTNGPIRLLDDLTIEYIEDSPVYLKACDPAGLNFESTPQFGQRYSFVRQPAPTGRVTFTCDWDGYIARALQLSRYVVLNSHCTEYAARRLTAFQPDEDQIAGLRNEQRFYAFHALKDGGRDWLTDDDARVLGGLLRRYIAEHEHFPERVLRAMQRCELSFRTPYTETAAVGVVTAFESLLKTREREAGPQFRTRVSAIAQELGIAEITTERAKRFYRLRSGFVHGEAIKVERGDEANRELRTFHWVLTQALRRAIEDVDFRCIFTSKTTVAERWPI